jgi:hypothetical protein
MAESAKHTLRIRLRRTLCACAKAQLLKGDGSRTRLWQNWLRDYDFATRTRHDFTCCTLTVWIYLIGGTNASGEEQLEIMRDLANHRDTPAGRTYGALNVKAKLAFWYQLAEWMTQKIVVPMPSDYSMAPGANQTLEALKRLDLNQQTIVLRNVVAKMGIDPLA